MNLRLPSEFEPHKHLIKFFIRARNNNYVGFTQNKKNAKGVDALVAS